MTMGWVKNYRSIEDWEWYKTENMAHLFQHLIRKANHEDRKWQGIDVKRGQVITGRSALAEQTGISEQSIRTCLNRLKSTSEITIQVTNKYSIITICNYDSYQTYDGEINQQINQQPNQQLTSNQPAINQQSTTNKNIKSKETKNIKKEISKEKKFDFKQSIIGLGVEEVIATDWLAVRDKKRASNTETAFKAIKTQIEQSGLPANECIKIAAERSWQGFKAEWLKEKPSTKYFTYAEVVEMVTKNGAKMTDFQMVEKEGVKVWMNKTIKL